jgi:hypothetical protein
MTCGKALPVGFAKCHCCTAAVVQRIHCTERVCWIGAGVKMWWSVSLARPCTAIAKCECPAQVFFFFAGMGILAVLFAIFLVPETRQVPIEEIEETVVHRHW